VAERPVSVARVAAELAAEIFETLADKTALLVGAGEMIELALEAMREAGLARVRIANRTRARAEALAGRFDASAHGLEELPEQLADADVVLTSIGGHEPVVTREDLERALRGRGHRPLFVIDLGVPRNVDPHADELDGVYLYDVDDLGRVAEANAEERRREKVRAEAIVLEEAQRFDGWLGALAAVPTIRDLRERAERIRSRELERALARLEGDAAQREVLEALTRGIVNKLLHAPISRLRAQEDREQGLATLEAARTLFALDDGESEADAGGGSGPDEER
jgi:glutamyl-tRNA reductase